MGLVGEGGEGGCGSLAFEVAAQGLFGGDELVGGVERKQMAENVGRPQARAGTGVGQAVLGEEGQDLAYQRAAGGGVVAGSMRMEKRASAVMGSNNTEWPRRGWEMAGLSRSSGQ